MSDHVTINEKVSRATRSAHLEHKDTPCSIDTVGALGMAGVANGLSSAVFRLKYANEARFYRTALLVVIEESKRLARKHEWEGSGMRFSAMAKGCLDYWLNDRCLACEGRGYETILGTPHLSNDACRFCNGTAKTPKPAMASREWDERFDLLLARIEDMERLAGSDVIARLAANVNDLAK